METELDDRVRHVAGVLAEHTQIPPLAEVESRQRRRRTRHAAGAAVATVAVIAAASVLGWRIDRSPSSTAGTPAGSPGATSRSAVAFEVGYMPSHYQLVSVEQGPPNVFVELTKRYAVDGDPRRGVIEISVEYGKVAAPRAYAAVNGQLHEVDINGRQGVAGWNTGRPGDGLQLVYTVPRPNLAIAIDSQGADINEADLLRVAASVRPATTGPVPAQAIVPTTIGETLANARLELSRAGLTVGHLSYEFSNSNPPGVVAAQSPSPGASLKTGAAVNLVITRSS